MTTSTITSERIDDIPLLLHWLREMHVDTIIDAVLDPPHGNRQGLSHGHLTVVFLAYILSTCNHFLSPVRDWVAKHHHCLEHALGQPIRETDCTDDRLEDLLDALGADQAGERIEEQLDRHLIRAYALPTETARIDTTTVSVYHQPAGESLLDFGHSKDHRPDLRQFKEVLGTLDPVGMPLCSAMVAGHCADDPLYLPVWQRLVKVIGHSDFLVVGDCKMASLATRAQIHAGGGCYLAPLPMTGHTSDALRTWVLAPPVPAVAIRLPGRAEPVGAGFEVAVAQTWTAETGKIVTWQERALVIRSDKVAHRQQQGLAARLARTEAALSQLKPGPTADLSTLTAQSHAILKRYDVSDYLQVTWTAHTTETRHYLKRGRHGPHSPYTMVATTQWQLTVVRVRDAVEEFNRLAGWRLYVTNAAVGRLALDGAARCYREQWQPERGFHRLKGTSLAIRPLLLRSDHRIGGLLCLLVIALRALTLLEFVVRRQLAQQHEPFQGLYAGNPQRSTTQPTAERVLRALNDITLYRLTDGRSTWYVTTPLSALQRRILALVDVPESIYTSFAQPSLPGP
jgi:transposase